MKKLFIPLIIWLSFLSVNTTRAQKQKPNILWLTCEDISPYLSFYGDSTANTPHLDQLASESMIFTHAYATVGVCAPARSSIITGMYPASIGTHHMRTAQDYLGWGKREYPDRSNTEEGPVPLDIKGDTIPQYSAVIPPYVKCFTEYLRGEGYYCTNNFKTDYQFAAPVTAWDENSRQAHWRHRREGQPFFSVFNFEVTHESRIWVNEDKPLTVDPDSVPVPPYYPDNEVIREDIARNYSNIELLDKQIGQMLDQLRADGLYENTIIFFYSDHGGPLPRAKRETYQSGLHVPFLVRMPHQERAGRYDQLISFVDLAPTVLSLAGMDPPGYMEGRAFLGAHQPPYERRYVYGSGDRFDFQTDMVRSVTDGRFMYIRNFHPEKSGYKPVPYRQNMDMMNEWLELYRKDALNDIQSRWFEAPRPREELYLLDKDPHEVNNLADNPAYRDTLKAFREALKTWQARIDDKGFVPEVEMIRQMWPNLEQPQTQKPTIIRREGRLEFCCPTPGASIVYMIAQEPVKVNLNSDWKLYTDPIQIPEAGVVYVMANRIGFKDSPVVERVFP